MITFQDLVCQESFRHFVEQRLKSGLGLETYAFPDKLPVLFKYRALSDYSIKDILNNQITLSAIGSFNDLFDGTIQQYGTKEEQRKAAEDEWAKTYGKFNDSIGFESSLDREKYVSLLSEHYKTESRLKFRLLEYLGTYACCFSTKRDSTLMWSHYANSNMGICIGYDFNTLPESSLLRNMLFPVAYSKDPVYLSDLLYDEHRDIYEYSLDAAVLCAALNKSDTWKYENEWRMIHLSLNSNTSLLYQPIRIPILPHEIHLGYHFLKPLFYYASRKEEREQSSKRIENIITLLSYVVEKKIPISLMVPQIGHYNLVPISISGTTLLEFIKHHFKDSIPENIRYYHTIHDELIDMIEENDNV